MSALSRLTPASLRRLITIAVGRLGTASTKDTGTSGNTVPLLDGANTWGAGQVVGSPAGGNQGGGSLNAVTLFKNGVSVGTGALDNIVEDPTPQLGGQLDVNGNSIGNGTLELLKFVETASAVNEVTVVNAATGNAPQLQATGDNANVSLNLVSKGTGVVQFNGADLTVAEGGTGVSTLTDGGVLLGNGTGAVVAMAVLADGEFIVGDGTTDPVAESGATVRTSLGLGTAAVKNVGVANGNVPQMDATGYPAADGSQITGLSTGPSQATQAALEAETNEDTYAPPDLIRHSPGVAKAWANFDVTGSLTDSYNVTSITDSGTGNWTANLTTAFSSADFSVVASHDGSGSTLLMEINGHPVTSSTIDIDIYKATSATDTTGARDDSGEMSFAAFGDQ